MTKLGTYPSNRYHASWVTQRLMNRAPVWAHIRKNPCSVGQQIVNPLGVSIEETLQQLAREKYNQFVSLADITQMDRLWRFDLPYGMEFTKVEAQNGAYTYTTPTTYATINLTEYELTVAEHNDMETLWYNNIPSRIEDGEVSYSYSAVIPRTLVSNLSSTSPEEIAINGYLYVTLRDNTTWEQQLGDMIYYPKVYITGTTRKGTTVTEALPLRYNGTFQTINEWQSIDEVSVSYLDATAYITIETFPIDRESYLDTMNVIVPADDGERPGFLRIESRTYGSTLVREGFVSADFNVVRQGVDSKEIYDEIELLDSNDQNVTLIDFVQRSNSKFIFAIDNDNLYVYDISLPYPDVKNLIDESPETRFDLYPDRWICNRDDVIAVKTRNLVGTSIPVNTRWSLLAPDGTTYYVEIDGTLSSNDTWTENLGWGNGNWIEQNVPFVLTSIGEWIITFEAQYYNASTQETEVLNTKILLFVPSITPEAQFALPDIFKNADSISIDSDGRYWIGKTTGYDNVYLMNVFYDYFMVDYINKRLYFKEEYSNVRVVI